MIEIASLRECFVGKRVFDGRRMCTCPDCGKHKVCYGVRAYVRPRDRQDYRAGSEEFPCLELICPQCLRISVFVIETALAGKLQPFEVDAEDRAVLERAGWLAGKTEVEVAS